MPRRNQDKPAIISEQQGAMPSAVEDPFAPVEPEVDLVRPQAKRGGDRRRNSGAKLPSLRKETR